MRPRRLLSIVVLTSVGLAPMAPPEHVHGSIDADGRHKAVTHRHADLHSGQGASSDHDRATVEDAERVLATLDLISTPPGVSFVPSRSVSTIRSLLHEPELLTRAVRSEFVERLIHAPPRAPTALRGPPATPFL